jgi:hypothetical protein
LWCRAALLSSILIALGASAGLAEPEAPGSGSEPPEGVEVSPTLDRLLQLPSSLEYGGGERGGMTRGQWRARYRELRDALGANQKALESAQKELQTIAGSADAWTVGPPIPGGGASHDAPLDYQLRQEIQRYKSEIEHLERTLRELDVRADLAGVPAEWRE